METPETIFKTWMERVWNQGDTEAIDEMLAANAPVHGLGEEPLPGAAGFRQFHAAFTAAFSDISIEVERQVVDGDHVAAHWTGTMVHKASGTKVPASGMAIATVRDGKIQEGWNSADFLPLLITLGIVQADAMERALS
jgi:ketosteroid isomerase-like protein